MDLGSDLVETYNSIKCLGMVQTSAKTDPWSSDKGNQISSDYRTALVGLGISGTLVGGPLVYLLIEQRLIALRSAWTTCSINQPGCV